MLDAPQPSPYGPRERLTVGLIGGVPPAMGGGGLEIQIAETSAGLQRLGHSVRRVESLARGDSFDVLHGFHAEPALWHLLPHWTRNRAPLVLSPVLPVAPGRERRALGLSARLPFPLTTARMRRQVFRRSQAIVALTGYERELICDVFGGPRDRTVIVGNGVDPVGESAIGVPALPAEPFALMVGNVSARKRQAEVLEAVGGRHPMVIAGGLLGDRAERLAFERTVERTGGLWLGEVTDAAQLRAIQRKAGALVLVSGAEALSLAVLESLSAGTPVIVSELPSHRELADRYPGWVRIVERSADIPAAFAAVASRPPNGPAPGIPTWTEIAERLVEVYRQALARGPAT